MRFEIIKNKIQDRDINNLVINMFRYMGTYYAKKEEEARNTKNKSAIEQILRDVCKYVEKGLSEKLSQNYYVVASEDPFFAIKYDNKYLMILKYERFEICVIRVPYICVSGKFNKIELEENEKKEIEEKVESVKEKANRDHFKLMNFSKKILTSKYNSHLVDKPRHAKIDENLLNEIILRNYFYSKAVSDKEKKNFLISDWVLSIQRDLHIFDENYHWNCIGSRTSQVYSEDLPKNCLVFYHVKIFDDRRETFDNKIKEFDLIIFKKIPVFESVMKNILSGRFYEVEFKHMVTFFSLIVFFGIMGYCETSYEDKDLNLINPFEKNVCLNKKAILGGIGFMFIVAIISGMINKKLKRKDRQKMTNEKTIN